MKNKSIVLILAFVVIAAAAAIAVLTLHKDSKDTEDTQAGTSSVEHQEDGVTVLSETYHVDQIYKSMKGPQSTQEFPLSENGERELVWIKGFKAVMVEPDGTSPKSQEFMCHSNLDIDIASHRERLGWKDNNPAARLFTLSQGQFDIIFPEGYGIPVYSDEKLSLTTQVLNLNDILNEHQVRHRVTIDYVKDSELEKPMKALFPVSAYGLKVLEGEQAHFNIEHAEEMQGEGCMVGENADSTDYKDSLGRSFTGHWVVKPGREVNHTLVTEIMSVPYDTTVHYIAVHLHPFAESMELRDLTTGETVFKSNVKGAEGKIGIDSVEYFSSAEGIPLYKDHEYQLISVYDNTSSEDQDSMAVMFLYVEDKEFDSSMKTALNPNTQAYDYNQLTLEE